MTDRIGVYASTAGGSRASVRASPADTVAQLKALLEPALGVPKFQQKLLLGLAILKDESTLAESGLADGAELTMLAGRPVPEWAAEWGLTGDHPVLLREYYETHGLEAPEWIASDEAIWEALHNEQLRREETRERLAAWSHLVFLSDEGGPRGEIHAAPGEEITIKAHGWIHNKNGDSCIHQLILAMDNRIVIPLSDGVPGHGRAIEKRITFQAPAAAGTYMLWRYGDLQYSMRDATQNFENRHGAAVQGNKYPSSFVGWLVVDP